MTEVEGIMTDPLQELIAKEPKPVRDAIAILTRHGQRFAVDFGTSNALAKLDALIGVMPFEDWRIANPEMAELREECSYCNGDGDCTCDCGDKHDCAKCDGKGEIDLSRGVYEAQKSLDVKKWIKAQLCTTT